MSEPNGKREWLNISAAEYHALPAFGSSAIRCFALAGQLEFYARYIAKTKVREDTDAMRMGRAFHAAMEDNGDWTERYCRVPTRVEDDEFVEDINKELDGKDSKAARLVPDADLNFKLPSHRAYFDAHKLRAERLGKDFLSDDEIDTVHQQVQAVYDNPECKDILCHRTGLLSEVACVFHHDSGIERKALIDRVISTGIVDFKKTCESSPFEFVRAARRLGYDYQLGDYLFVTGKTYACIISVNDSAPFEAHAWEMPPALMRQRMDDAERYTTLIAQQMRMAEIDEKDSQGIPLSWHNEGWGARLPFDEQQLSMRTSA